MDERSREQFLKLVFKDNPELLEIKAPRIRPNVKRLKHYTLKKFERIERYVEKLPDNLLLDNFQSVVEEVTKKCSVDIQRVRAVYHWIKIQDLDLISAATDKMTPNTICPMMLFHFIANGSTTFYSLLFEIMLRFLKIASHRVEGYVKDLLFEPGDHVQAVKHVWNVAFIADSEGHNDWQLFDVATDAENYHGFSYTQSRRTSQYSSFTSTDSSGDRPRSVASNYKPLIRKRRETLKIVQRVSFELEDLNLTTTSNADSDRPESAPAKTKAVTEYLTTDTHHLIEDAYFSPAPSDFIRTHFPLEPNYQLLPIPHNLIQFEEEPVVRDIFSSLDLTLPPASIRQVLRTQNGTVELTMEYIASKPLIFNTCVSRWGQMIRANCGTSYYSTTVKHDVKIAEVTLHVRVPEPGTYRLGIEAAPVFYLGSAHIIKPREVCVYKIKFDLPEDGEFEPPPILPMPGTNCTGYGPISKFMLLNFKPDAPEHKGTITSDDGKFRIDLHLINEYLLDSNYRVHIHYYDKNWEECAVLPERYCTVNKDKKQQMLVIKVEVPKKGDYALEIQHCGRETHKWANLCNYLLKASKGVGSDDNSRLVFKSAANLGFAFVIPIITVTYVNDNDLPFQGDIVKSQHRYAEIESFDLLRVSDHYVDNLTVPEFQQAYSDEESKRSARVVNNTNDDVMVFEEVHSENTEAIPRSATVSRTGYHTEEPANNMHRESSENHRIKSDQNKKTKPTPKAGKKSSTDSVNTETKTGQASRRDSNRGQSKKNKNKREPGYLPTGRDAVKDKEHRRKRTNKSSRTPSEQSIGGETEGVIEKPDRSGGGISDQPEKDTPPESSRENSIILHSATARKRSDESEKQEQKRVRVAPGDHEGGVVLEEYDSENELSHHETSPAPPRTVHTKRRTGKTAEGTKSVAESSKTVAKHSYSDDDLSIRDEDAMNDDWNSTRSSVFHAEYQETRGEALEKTPVDSSVPVHKPGEVFVGQTEETASIHSMDEVLNMVRTEIAHAEITPNISRAHTPYSEVHTSAAEMIQPTLKAPTPTRLQVICSEKERNRGRRNKRKTSRETPEQLLDAVVKRHSLTGGEQQSGRSHRVSESTNFSTNIGDMSDREDDMRTSTPMQEQLKKKELQETKAMVGITEEKTMESTEKLNYQETIPTNENGAELEQEGQETVYGEKILSHPKKYEDHREPPKSPQRATTNENYLYDIQTVLPAASVQFDNAKLFYGVTEKTRLPVHQCKVKTTDMETTKNIAVTPLPQIERANDESTKGFSATNIAIAASDDQIAYEGKKVKIKRAGFENSVSADIDETIAKGVNTKKFRAPWQFEIATAVEVTVTDVPEFETAETRIDKIRKLKKIKKIQNRSTKIYGNDRRPKRFQDPEYLKEALRSMPPELQRPMGVTRRVDHENKKRHNAIGYDVSSIHSDINELDNTASSQSNTSETEHKQENMEKEKTLSGKQRPLIVRMNKTTEKRLYFYPAKQPLNTPVGQIFVDRVGERPMRQDTFQYADFNRVLLKELKTYRKPSSIVGQLLKATFLLLGESEVGLESWDTLSGLLSKSLYKDSLTVRMKNFNPDNVDDSVREKTQQILNQISGEDAESVSKPVKILFNWVQSAV